MAQMFLQDCIHRSVFLSLFVSQFGLVLCKVWFPLNRSNRNRKNRNNPIFAISRKSRFDSRFH